MFSNIFNQTQPKKPSSLQYEQAEFDNTQFMLESMVDLETDYFYIMHESLLATHYGEVDGNHEILTEGVKNVAEAIGDWFKKVIEKIKQLVSKAVMYISAYLGNMDKFVKKYSNEILKADPSFTIKGYEYSFDKEASLEPIEELVSEFNKHSHDPSKIVKDEIAQMRIKNLSQESMNKLRGRFLQINRPVSKEEYDAELKRMFRGYAEEESDIEVDKGVLKKAVENIAWGTQELKKVNKEKRSMIIYLETIKETLNKGARIQYNEGDKMLATKHLDQKKMSNNQHPFSSSLDATLKAYHSYMFDYARANINMYLPILNARIQALKDMLKQSQQIIRRSLPYKEKKEETGK